MNETYVEEYRVKYIRDKSSDRIVSEFWYNSEGQLDRKDDLPAHIDYDEQGRPVRMSWNSNNISHRENGPQTININPENNIIYRERWLKHGKFHRSDNNPAVVERDPADGRIKKTEYWENDQLLDRRYHSYRPKDINPPTM